MRDVDEHAIRDYDPIQPQGWRWRETLKKLFAPLVLLVGLAIKFGAFTLKFFGIFISIGGYALIWGWRFAAGFVLLILVHEAGHYVEAKRQGLNPSLPVFVPFLGAYVALKNAPVHPFHNALVSLAGPIAGGLGAAATWWAGEAMDSRLLLALAFTAFLLNLFNLAPLPGLDGGYAWRALTALRRGHDTGRALVVAALYFGLGALFVLAMLQTHVEQTRL